MTAVVLYRRHMGIQRVDLPGPGVRGLQESHDIRPFFDDRRGDRGQPQLSYSDFQHRCGHRGLRQQNGAQAHGGLSRPAFLQKLACARRGGRGAGKSERPAVAEIRCWFSNNSRGHDWPCESGGNKQMRESFCNPSKYLRMEISTPLRELSRQTGAKPRDKSLTDFKHQQNP